MAETPLPQPAETGLQAPFWAAARDGVLAFQRCANCGHAFLPAREECPECLLPEVTWESASGDAKLISWVVYHRAFHPAFADRIPYAVAVVELKEGPRLISNLTGIDDLEAFRADQDLRVRFDTEGSLVVPRFVPA